MKESWESREELEMCVGVCVYLCLSRYVCTQTCVPHVVVPWTPNCICKLQSFSNAKEYYFMERERITFFHSRKTEKQTNKKPP